MSDCHSAATETRSLIHRNQLPRPGEGFHCRAGRPLSKGCLMLTGIATLRVAVSPIQSRKHEEQPGSDLHFRSGSD